MLDRTSPPASYPIDHFALPDYDSVNLGSHAECYVIRDEKLPVVHIELLFESGKSKQVIPGTAYYAIKMLPEGTLNHTADEIANGFESLGSFVEFGSGIDHSSVKIYAQSAHIDATLDLLTEVLTTPAFREDEYRTLQEIRTQQIAVQHAKNNQYATVKFNQLLFGENHPLGTILSPDSVKEVPIEEVKDFYKHTLFTNPKIFVTGSVSDSVMDKLGQIVRSLTCTSGIAPDNTIVTAKGTSHEPRPNSEQVSLRMGMHSIDKLHPDIHSLSIANTMLGGYFGSRLMKTIREDLGYTYGIYSTLVHTTDYSYWMISSELIKKHADNGLKEIDNQLTLLASTPPPVKELETLKNYLKGKLLSSVDSIFSKGNLIKNLKVGGLEDSYYNDYLDAVDQITPKDISEVTEKYLLAPEKTTLLVG